MLTQALMAVPFGTGWLIRVAARRSAQSLVGCDTLATGLVGSWVGWTVRRFGGSAAGERYKKKTVSFLFKMERMYRYRYAPLLDVLAAVGIAERLGVSEIARSPRGFVAAYERFGRPAYVESAVDPSGGTWGATRDNFIARHLAQYLKNPTERRRLALLMWAFDVRGSHRKVLI